MVLYIIIALLIITNIYCVVSSRAKLRKMTYYDRITQGVNQAYLQKWIKERIGKKERETYCLGYLNLVKFKAINDSYGYEKGNAVLKLIYDCIRDKLEPEEKVSRMAADNYVLFLRYESSEKLKERIKEMGASINEAFNKGNGKYYHLNFQVGIYIITEESLGYSLMVDRANIARQSLANQNRDIMEIAFYNEKDRTVLLREKEMEDRMEAALANGEFEVYLQPKLGMDKNEIAGAEALIRWNSPEKGLIPPSHFIDLFERNGFIRKIDLFVFETVCRYMKKWKEEGIPMLTISVNLSRIHFMERNFLDEFDAIRIKYGVLPEYLEFELTECIVFEDTDRLSSAMLEMRKKGYSCSLDDFGNGYSSLNILKELPVTALKLDRGFFIGLYNEQSRVVIRAIINMAKELKMKTVAEGVDTPEQCTFLRQSGCDMLQAFIYARPMPIERYEAMLKMRN